MSSFSMSAWCAAWAAAISSAAGLMGGAIAAEVCVVEYIRDALACGIVVEVFYVSCSEEWLV